LKAERVSMKWQSILAGALASVFGALFIAGTVSADMQIVNDPGGEISSYLRTFYKVRATDERIVIDGPCLSACMFTARRASSRVRTNAM